MRITPRGRSPPLETLHPGSPHPYLQFPFINTETDFRLYSTHFTDEEIRLQEVKCHVQSHTAKERQGGSFHLCIRPYANLLRSLHRTLAPRPEPGPPPEPLWEHSVAHSLAFLISWGHFCSQHPKLSVHQPPCETASQGPGLWTNTISTPPPAPPWPHTQWAPF